MMWRWCAPRRIVCPSHTVRNMQGSKRDFLSDESDLLLRMSDGSCLRPLSARHSRTLRDSPELPSQHSVSVPVGPVRCPQSMQTGTREDHCPATGTVCTYRSAGPSHTRVPSADCELRTGTDGRQTCAVHASRQAGGHPSIDARPVWCHRVRRAG